MKGTRRVYQRCYKIKLSGKLLWGVNLSNEENHLAVKEVRRWKFDTGPRYRHSNAPYHATDMTFFCVQYPLLYNNHVYWIELVFCWKSGSEKVRVFLEETFEMSTGGFLDDVDWIIYFVFPSGNSYTTTSSLAFPRKRKSWGCHLQNDKNRRPGPSRRYLGQLYGDTGTECFSRASLLKWKQQREEKLKNPSGEKEGRSERKKRKRQQNEREQLRNQPNVSPRRICLYILVVRAPSDKRVISLLHHALCVVQREQI